MKISIIGDTHCGYAYDSERGPDSFKALDEIIDRSKDADLIIQAGDLFDMRQPRQEILAKTAKILNKAQNSDSTIKLVQLLGKHHSEITQSAMRGTPIVSIHGNHDRRSKHMINPLQALEHAGLLIHLHLATAVFEIQNPNDPAHPERIAIHGMSSVPERYAKEIFTHWNPKPVPNATNILLMHQSTKEAIYSPLEPPTLSMTDLPDGFNLYINGHIHWFETQQFKSGTFLQTGSTTYTSIKPKEAEQGKGFFLYNGRFPEFIPLRYQRKVYLNEFTLNPTTQQELEYKLSVIPKLDPKPIFIAKLNGKQLTPIDFNSLSTRFGERAILMIRKPKSTHQTNSLKPSVERLSPEEHGFKILEQKVREIGCKLNPYEVFEPLSEGNIDTFVNATSKDNKSADISNQTPIDNTTAEAAGDNVSKDNNDVNMENLEERNTTIDTSKASLEIQTAAEMERQEQSRT